MKTFKEFAAERDGKFNESSDAASNAASNAASDASKMAGNAVFPGKAPVPMINQAQNSVQKKPTAAVGSEIKFTLEQIRHADMICYPKDFVRLIEKYSDLSGWVFQNKNLLHFIKESGHNPEMLAIAEKMIIELLQET